MKKYFVITYGCQGNKANSERIATILEKKGYRPASNPERADLVVINMCSVRQNAVERVYGRVGSLKGKKIILTGCVLKEDREKLKKKVEIIDFKDLSKIKPRRRYKEGFVPIMEGCNNYCTYCVVPYTRGKENYRKKDEIIKEVKDLIKKGYKEITLLGQTISSYPSFPKLLKEINGLAGNFKINFLTSHPKDFSDELIRVIKESKKIKKYIYLPVQSGDNTILKRMNRKYTRENYLKIIEKLRKEIPDVQISTDVIVGFPGETKKQFANTIDLFKKVKFDNAYVACFSPRPGTPAAKLKDNVSLKEKERRAIVLRKLCKNLASQEP